MRIAIFSNAYKPTVSGVVTSMVRFRRGLLAAGHEVHVVAPAYDDYLDQEPYVFRLPAFEVPGDLDVSLALPLKAPVAIAIRDIMPAVIHSQHPVLVGDLAADFAADLEVPLVFTFHTRYDEYAQEYVPVLPQLAGRLMEEVVQRYLDRCAHVVAPTPSIRAFIHRHYEVDVPVSVVPTPVDLSQYDSLDPHSIRQRLGLEDAEVLLYLGRLAGEKGLDFLLRAVSRVVSARPHVCLLVVGVGPEENHLRDFVRELGLQEHVIFVGVVPQAEVPHFAAAADLFVFSSVTETQGLVLIEVMAAGTPAVAVEAPGSVDVLSQGGGVLVPTQEEAFADAVLALLTDPARRQELGRQAARVTQQYGIAEATRSLLAAYEAAIEAGPRHPQ